LECGAWPPLFLENMEFTLICPAAWQKRRKAAALQNPVAALE